MAQLLSDTNVESPIDLNELLSESLDFDDDSDDQDELQSPSAWSDSTDLSGLLSPASRPERGRKLPRAARPTHPVDATAAPPLSTAAPLSAAEDSALRRAVEATEARATAERQSYRVAVEAEHARTRQEMDSLRRKVQLLQAEVPTLRERLGATKASFAALRITDAQYETLVARPEEQVSVVEHVQLRVHELLRGSTVDEAAMAALHAKAAAAGSAQAMLQAETAAKDALQARLTEAHARASQLQAEAAAARSESRRLVAEAAEAATAPEGVARARLALAEAQLAEQRAELDVRSRAATEHEAELARLRTELAEGASKLSFLQQDKDYLSRQVADLQERGGACEARLAKKEGKVAELKAALATAQERLLADTAAQAEGYSVKLEAEMLKWEQQAKRAQQACPSLPSPATLSPPPSLASSPPTPPHSGGAGAACGVRAGHR